jgi:Ca-activated chloride channel family protein
MKRIVRWSMRGAVLALLSLAILNPSLSVAGPRKRVYVIDASASVSASRGAETFTSNDALRLATHDLQSLHPGDLVALVAFGAKPAVLIPPTPVSEVRFSDIEGVDASSTDLAAALATAAALAEGGEIILFSDGRSTAGRVPVERIRVPVNPFPLGPVGGADASIRSIDAPATVPPGASFQIRIAVESTGPWRGDLSAGDERRPLEFTGPGRQEVVLTRTLSGEELILALKLGGSDLCPENDAAEVKVWRDSRTPRVVVLGPDLRGAAEADVIVIERLRADAVPRSEQARLAGLVRDGGAGLVMLGGSSAFALGGWGGSPLEDLVPFWAFPDERSAVVILLDRSGSMGKPAPAPTGAPGRRACARDIRIVRRSSMPARPGTRAGARRGRG